MRKVILIPLLLLSISHNTAMCDDRNNSEEIPNLVADSNMSKFQMAWHPGGAKKQENIPVAPAGFRVFHIETQRTPPKEMNSLLSSGTEYGLIGFSDDGQTKFICGLRRSSEQVVGYDEFFIDLNHNGNIEKDEFFKGEYHDSTMGPEVIDCHYGSIDLNLQSHDGKRIHRVFAWYHMLSPFRSGELYLNSQCFLDGHIRFGDKEVKAVLIDYNCDGHYGSGQVSYEWVGTLGPRELDYDRIGWDVDGDGRIHYTEQHFVGSCTIFEDRVYRIGSSPDGQIVTVQELQVPMGYLQMPAKRAIVSLVGELGPINLNMSDGVAAVPAGTYWVDYARIEEPDDNGDLQRITKSGIYFEKPWKISSGITTRIKREMLIVTEEDRQRYKEKIRAMSASVTAQKVKSILNKPLHKINEFGLELDSIKVQNENILLCFFDMEQRPSRNCILQINKKAEELKNKEVVVIAVHASKVDQAKLDEWAKKNNIAFPVGMVQGDEEETRFSWGVKSLPWLILTDNEHLVVSEGFRLRDLDNQLKQGNQE